MTIEDVSEQEYQRGWGAPTSMHACMHIHMYMGMYVHAYVCIYAGTWTAASHGESALGTSGDVNGAISCARGVVSTSNGPEDAANV